MKNKYAYRSRISEREIREIVRYFAVDLTALQACELSGLNRNIFPVLLLATDFIGRCASASMWLVKPYVW